MVEHDERHRIMEEGISDSTVVTEHQNSIDAGLPADVDS